MLHFHYPEQEFPFIQTFPQNSSEVWSRWAPPMMPFVRCWICFFFPDLWLCHFHFSWSHITDTIKAINRSVLILYLWRWVAWTLARLYTPESILRWMSDAVCELWNGRLGLCGMWRRKTLTCRPQNKFMLLMVLMRVLLLVWKGALLWPSTSVICFAEIYLSLLLSGS